MATDYTLARAATSYHPKVQEKGVFAIDYPIDGDTALAAPFVTVANDTIALGWIPKGVKVIDAVGFFSEAGTSSTVELGYKVGSTVTATGIGGTVVVNSSTVTKYQLYNKTRPVLFDSSVIADTVIPGRALALLTVTAISSSSDFKGHVTIYMTYDDVDYTNPPTSLSQVL